MKQCSSCGAENDNANMFCGKCGASLNVHEPAPAAPDEPEKRRCPSCGIENDSNNMFCGKCGAPLNVHEPAPAAPRETGKKRCPSCGTENNSTYIFCEKCGAPLSSLAASQPVFQRNPAAAWPGPVSAHQTTPQGSFTAQPDASFPMGWHKFLIYFALWAGALINVVNGLSSFSSNKFFYDRINGLVSLDIFYCMALIALAVLCIVTRFQLAGFKRMGPRLLLGLYAANLAVSLFYMMMAYTMMQNSGSYINASELMSGSNFVAPIIMIIANYIYYKKRAVLFVN